MGAFTYIETDTGTNVDIHAATAVGAYTSTGDKLIMVDVSIDAVAGNGDYVMYVTRQIGGSGSAYRILPQTTMAAASGLTAISAQSGWITVRNGDVLTCYVVGLAGDTTTPDWTTRWFELAGVTAAAVADAVLDEATADHTTAGSLSKAVVDILTDTGTTLDGKIDTIDGNVYAILADTGTDGVVLKAAGLNADAVTKIQSGLALEATLTAIKGAGWDNQTLVAINQLLSNGFGGASVEDIVNFALAPIFGAGWTNQTLVKIVSDIAALATATALAALDDKVDIVDGILDDLYNTGIPAIKKETAAILEDTGTTLDTLIKDIPTNAELTTALGTADDAVLAAVAAAKSVIDNIHDTDLPAIKAETAAILEDTGTTLPAVLEAIDNFIDTEVAAILEDTGTTIPATLATIAGYTDGIAGDVWSHATRTLTVPAVAMSDPEDGTTLTLYKDADINIEFTGLTIPTGAKKVVFTVKDNLDDADTAAALQATYQLTAVPAETHTLNYINSATPPTLTNPVTFTVTTDSVEFDMTAAAAYYLPRYERGYLKWDLKLITATTVQILQQGLVQILGTSTRTVA